MAQQVRRGDVSTISAVIVPSRSSPLHTYDMDQRHSYKGVQGSCRRMIMPPGYVCPKCTMFGKERSMQDRTPSMPLQIMSRSSWAETRMGSDVSKEGL